MYGVTTIITKKNHTVTQYTQTQINKPDPPAGLFLYTFSDVASSEKEYFINILLLQVVVVVINGLAVIQLPNPLYF